MSDISEQRRYYERMIDEIAETCREQHEKLQAENAKLRELVKDMSICMDNSKPHCKRCKFQETDCQWFKFIDRMHELGVEA